MWGPVLGPCNVGISTLQHRSEPRTLGTPAHPILLPLSTPVACVGPIAVSSLLNGLFVAAGQVVADEIRPAVLVDQAVAVRGE